MGRLVFTTSEVARLVGWSTTRTRRWLLRNNAAVRRGGRYITTPTMLREAFPEIWQEIVLEVVAED